MDGLFSLIWVVFIVVTLVNSANRKNKKKQQSQQPSAPPFTAQPANAPVKPMDFRQFRDVISTEMQNRTQRPAQPQQVHMADVMAPAPGSGATVAAPRVHPHLSLDCDLDDPSGSMDFISTEGVDPCHDDDLPGRDVARPAFPAMSEQPGLTLEWTGDALVRSVIMQEVLTRPCQRKRR